MIDGRLGLVLGVLAHMGGCGGGCAHMLSAPAHVAGGGFRAAEALHAAPRVAAPAVRGLGKGAAVLVDTGLEVAAAGPDVESAGGGDGTPPDLLLCHVSADCGAGRTCDLLTGPIEIPPPWFPRSDQPSGICRPACRAAADCFANERCLGGVDPSEASAGACVPGR